MSLVHQEQTRVVQVAVLWASVVIWLTIFATFTLPGRTIQPTADSLDGVALFKVACRLLAVTTLGWIIFSHFRNGEVRRLVGGFTPWIVYVAWAIISTAWSPLRSITLGQAGGQVTLLFLAIVVALTCRAGEEKYFRQCVTAMFIYCLVYGGGAVVLPQYFDVGRTSDNSVVHPTALGATASLGLVLMTSLLLTSTWKWISKLAIVTMPIFLLAILVAQNRMSLALTMAICCGLIVAKGQSFKLAATAVVASLFGFVYLLADPGLTAVEMFLGNSVDFVQRGQSSDELSQLSGRAEMWTAMWNSYLESPILGHGYFVCSSTGVLYVWYEEMNYTAHNIVLQALVCTGVVGLVLFLIWHFQIIRIYISNVLRKLNSPQVAALTPALFFWFLGWTLLNASYLGPVRPESTIYAVMFGLVMGQNFPKSQIDLQSRLPSASGGNV